MASARQRGFGTHQWLANRNHLSDMEINPIMVRAQGSGVAAVDVRLIRK